VRHPSEDDLVLYRYDEACDAGAIQSHLETCSTCQAACRALDRTLAVVGTLDVPEPDETFEARTWNRLTPALETQPRRRWFEALRPGALGFAGATAVLLVAAFIAGRYWPRAIPATLSPSSTASDDRVRDRVLLIAVGDHLDRSQMALLELVNSKAAATVDISAEQGWVRDLVPANRLYRQTAAAAGEDGVASLLDDLERILLEISHSPSTLSPDEFNQIRQRIESESIIFKVRVLGSEVRARQRDVVRAPARQLS
jgi:hypothetical protein